MQYALYYSTLCYFCQKVLMHLRGKDHKIQLVNIADASHQQELISGGGKSQVPCLRIQNTEGEVSWLYESDDIIDYMSEINLVA